MCILHGLYTRYKIPKIISDFAFENTNSLSKTIQKHKYMFALFHLKSMKESVVEIELNIIHFSLISRARPGPAWKNMSRLTMTGNGGVSKERIR